VKFKELKLEPFILSIDAGTTGITVLILDKQASICKKYYKEFTQYYPQSGWVEHDGEEIWSVTLMLLQSAFHDFSPNNCAAIGITNQRETTLIWNRKTGKPIHHAIVWQCRRTEEICRKLKQAGYEDLISDKTGLVLDSYFSGTKIKWLLDNVDGSRANAEKGELAFGTIDSWLLWKLTGGSIHSTDYTNASRTMLFNIDEKKWDNELLQILNIPKNLLPEVNNSSGKFGKTDKQLFGEAIPITGIAGDQQAALFGQGCFEKGNTKCTYGTGCFLLINTGDNRINSTSGLLTTIACNPQGEPSYALEGSVFIGGAVIQWLRDELQLLVHAKNSEEMSLKVENSNGVVIVPAFTGLGAPYWDMNARGIITGLSRGSNRNHIVRAALEGIAFQVYDLLEAVSKDLDIDISNLNVDGGAVANNFLMQFQADILQINIDRPKNIESTALGAGMLAGLGVGFWKNPSELKEVRKIDKIFYPTMSEDNRTSLLSNWKSAIRKLQYT
jgi:glycerol kinase